MFEITEKQKAVLTKNGIEPGAFSALDELLEAIDDAIVDNIVSNGDEPDATGIEMQKVYDQLRKTKID